SVTARGPRSRGLQRPSFRKQSSHADWTAGRRPRSFHRGAAWHAHRRIARSRERLKNLFGMRGVARLDGDVELGALGRNVEEQPMMIDGENIGAERAEHSGDLPENAGPIGDRQPK